MKKLLLSILCLLFYCVNAQTFTLTSDGFVDSENSSKSYVVFEFDGKSQSELYNEVLIAIGKTFVSPNDVVSKVENKQLTINGILKNAVARTKVDGGWTLNFTMIFEFKEGKVRVDAPSVNRIYYENREMYVKSKGAMIGLMNGTEFGIFSKNGDLKIELAKQTLENSINKLMLSMLLIVAERDINSDW
jgi:hypothetical protein